MNIRGALVTSVLALGLISSPAYSYVLDDGTDVGGEDTWVATAVGLNSSESSEETWASAQATSFAGNDVVLTFSKKSEPAVFDYTKDGVGVIAFQLYTAPSYFLVKDSKTHVLFKNEASIDWGVFNLSTWFPNKEELQLSHLTEFNGSDVTVPEPGTALLIATGIFGLIASRKRMKKAV